MSAASACAAGATAATETAVAQAWLLFSNILATQALSPFSDGA